MGGTFISKVLFATGLLEFMSTDHSRGCTSSSEASLPSTQVNVEVVNATEKRAVSSMIHACGQTLIPPSV